MDKTIWSIGHKNIPWCCKRMWVFSHCSAHWLLYLLFLHALKIFISFSLEKYYTQIVRLLEFSITYHVLILYQFFILSLIKFVYILHLIICNHSHFNLIFAWYLKNRFLINYILMERFCLPGPLLSASTSYHNSYIFRQINISNCTELYVLFLLKYELHVLPYTI